METLLVVPSDQRLNEIFVLTSLLLSLQLFFAASATSVQGAIASIFASSVFYVVPRSSPRRQT